MAEKKPLSAMLARSYSLLDHRRSVWLILLVAVLLHWPVLNDSGFFADDFIHYQVFTQSHSLTQAMVTQFDFFSPDSPQTQQLKAVGALPWYLPETAKIHFFRPLTTLSQWIDYQLWPQSPELMHLHGFLLVLLAWLFSFLFYQKLLDKRTAVLSFLLLVLDASLLVPLSWIAARNSLLCFLLATITLYCLSKNTIKSSVLALAFYVLALLSAEAGIAILAWVLMYFVFLSPLSKKQKLWLSAIFLLMTGIWRAYYQWHGYGTAAIAHYINPLSADFIGQALTQYPVLVLHNLLGIEGSDFYWRGAWHDAEALLAWLFMLLPLWAAYQLKCLNRVWGFCYSSALLSSLPFAAISLSDARLSIVPFILFAPCFAVLMTAFFQHKSASLALKSFIYGLLFCHIILQAAALSAWCVLPRLNPDMVDARFEPFICTDKTVLIANSVDNFRLMYYPYRRFFYRQCGAPALAAVMDAETALSIKRLNSHQYQLTQSSGLLLTPDVVDKRGKPLLQGVEGMSYLLSGFFASDKQTFYRGQRFQLPDASLEITALYQGRPQTVVVSLEKSVQWLYWSWQERRYKILAPLAIGQRLVIAGKYDKPSAP